MKAVSIRDATDHILEVDLIHILRLAGEDALASLWRCANVECVGPGAGHLHAVSDRAVLQGPELVAIAGQVDQVIDGDFVAQLHVESPPWLVIRAIDSSEYVVITSDDALLRRIRETFKHVTDSPDDVAFVGQ